MRADITQPLLSRHKVASRAEGPGSQKATAQSRRATVTLCTVHVLLSMAGPILLDWVKRAHGGAFNFHIPALTFNAYGISVVVGATWTFSESGWQGLKKLNRPDMLWRFCLTASLFTIGDILSFLSLQSLDPGTFSLVGKGLNIVLTVLLTRLLLGRRQTPMQSLLVCGVALSTFAFCYQEALAAGHLRAPASNDFAGKAMRGDLEPLESPGQDWFFGILERITAVTLLTFAAVMQEKWLTREPDLSFMLQQCWMGCGALATSMVTFRLWRGLPPSAMFDGFGDWRVILLLFFYVANGMTAGLMVKRLGALTKALCVPIYLGGCYAYAVCFGGAVLSAGAVLAWVISTGLILGFAVSKACGGKARH